MLQNTTWAVLFASFGVHFKILKRQSLTFSSSCAATYLYQNVTYFQSYVISYGRVFKLLLWFLCPVSNLFVTKNRFIKHYASSIWYTNTVSVIGRIHSISFFLAFNKTRGVTRQHSSPDQALAHHEDKVLSTRHWLAKWMRCVIQGHEKLVWMVLKKISYQYLSSDWI